jgi:hypothetical protein
MKDAPDVLNRIVDKVLAYRPKPRTKAQKKRRRRALAKSKKKEPT